MQGAVPPRKVMLRTGATGVRLAVIGPYRNRDHTETYMPRLRTARPFIDIRIGDLRLTAQRRPFRSIVALCSLTGALAGFLALHR